MVFQKFDLEALAFSPAGVHAQQHRRPVLAFGSTSTGMDFKIGVVLVGLAGKQRLDLATTNFFANVANTLFGIGND